MNNLEIKRNVIKLSGGEESSQYNNTNFGTLCLSENNIKRCYTNIIKVPHLTMSV